MQLALFDINKYTEWKGRDNMPRKVQGKDSPGNDPGGRRYTGKRLLPADWGSVDAALLQRVVSSITNTGCAVRFGYTRDGGAYALGVLGDGDPYTLYISPRDDISEELKSLCEAFE